jgi:hypothetical protein
MHGYAANYSNAKYSKRTINTYDYFKAFLPTNMYTRAHCIHANSATGI